MDSVYIISILSLPVVFSALIFSSRNNENTGNGLSEQTNQPSSNLMKSVHDSSVDVNIKNISKIKSDNINFLLSKKISILRDILKNYFHSVQERFNYLDSNGYNILSEISYYENYLYKPTREYIYLTDDFLSFKFRTTNVKSNIIQLILEHKRLLVSIETNLLSFFDIRANEIMNYTTGRFVNMDEQSNDLSFYINFLDKDSLISFIEILDKNAFIYNNSTLLSEEDRHDFETCVQYDLLNLLHSYSLLSEEFKELRKNRLYDILVFVNKKLNIYIDKINQKHLDIFDKNSLIIENRGK